MLINDYTNITSRSQSDQQHNHKRRVMSKSEPTGTASDALFRVNKRRKIYRRRNVDEQDDDGSSATPDSPEADSGMRGQTQLVRRPLAKKHGIGFSTAGSKPAQQEDVATQTAVVPFQPAENEDQATHDRFVKPAGKAAVIEDKHLYVYSARFRTREKGSANSVGRRT